jgi:hypothetical protein
MEAASILSHFVLDPSCEHLARTGHCILFLTLVVFVNISNKLAVKPSILLVYMMWKTQLQTCPVLLSHDFLIFIKAASAADQLFLFQSWVALIPS